MNNIEIFAKDLVKLVKLEEQASNLIFNMIKEHKNLSQEQMFSKYEQFESVIKDLEQICPIFSQYYMQMYKQAEKHKFSKKYYHGF